MSSQTNAAAPTSAAAAFGRLQQMMAMPPSQRPPDFHNPLERIEELLTCPICLERYKMPKLLPCQHTFCMEPCLDGCADIVKRVVKCPECRAEHSLPYDGCRGFQTNYTLMGFLEVHLQASADNADDLEAYIDRYNLQRCCVCQEKARLDYCHHCEKQICDECRQGHMTLMKRDLARMMNQVKRLSNRITEASDGLSKGMESMKINCTMVKDEVRDTAKRHMKDLKKKEEECVNEIETFYAVETRLMRSLRDTLELESSNINEACAKLDAYLKGETELREDEVVFYKQLFTDGLEYLRSFHPDDMFAKKLRFTAGTDAMSAAVVQFGELFVCSAAFGGRWTQMEQQYSPKLLNIGLESDRYRGAKEDAAGKTPGMGEREASAWSSRGAAAPNYQAHKKLEEDPNSLRNRRRQDIQLEAWSRVRDGHKTPSSSGGAHKPQTPAPPVITSTSKIPSPSSAAVSASAPHRVRGSPFTPGDGKSTVKEMNSAVQQHGAVESDAAMSVSTSNSGGSVNQDAAPANNQYPLSRAKPPLPRQPSSTDETSLNERVENIRRQHEHRQQQQEEQLQAVVIKASAQLKAAAPANKLQHSSSEEEDSLPGHGITPIHVTHYTNVFQAASMQPSKEPTPPPLEGGARRRSLTHQVLADDVSAARALASKHESTSRYERATPNYDWKKYLIPEPGADRQPADDDDAIDARRSRFMSSRSLTNPELIVTNKVTRVNDYKTARAGGGYEAGETRRQRYGASRHAADGASNESSLDASNEPLARASAGLPLPDRHRTKYRRKAEQSRSNTTQIAPGAGSDGETAPTTTALTLGRTTLQPRIDYANKAKQSLKFGEKGTREGEFNWPRGVAVMADTGEVIVCDSSNHRIQMFTKRGAHVRSLGRYGNGKGEFDCLAGVATNKYNQLIVTDRYNHRVQIFEAATGVFIREFGQHGQTNGRFNNPWGVVVDDQGFIYVCDKDNHRVQIFQVRACSYSLTQAQADGAYVGKFGQLGNRDGQFQNPHFIAVNRQHQLIVTDTGNHRVQVFDHNGHFMFAFGSVGAFAATHPVHNYVQEGFHDGQFKYPRGVAVDADGFIVVADSGNNRVQVFDATGRYHSSFGTWGTGDGQMKGVEAVAVTADGRVIVSDRENHRVQIF